jgi:hypothetical protein
MIEERCSLILDANAQGDASLTSDLSLSLLLPPVPLCAFSSLHAHPLGFNLSFEPSIDHDVELVSVGADFGVVDGDEDGAEGFFEGDGAAAF